MKTLKYCTFLFMLILLHGTVSTAQSESPDSTQDFNLHFQQTVITQGHPHFKAPYTGKNSLKPEAETATSITSTLFMGLRLWPGAAVYLNPELSGGAGISQAVGLAGFSNGETFRIGSAKPVVYLARLFLRQIFNLGGALVKTDDAPNLLKDEFKDNYISLTAGKFAITDMFDNNSYSHDPRSQFMNWSLMSAGAWDYPADTRGYTWGLEAELHSLPWVFRIAAVLLPKNANGMQLDTNVTKAHGLAFEAERTYYVQNRKGVLRFLLFYNRGRMGSYSETVNNPAFHMNVAQSRQYGRTKYGFSINAEQELAQDLGVFLRMSWNDGHNETWVFTEIDRSLSLGFVLNEKLWNKNPDQIGLAFVMNGISEDHRDYLAHGGYGFIIGDGKLNYSSELISELYYKTEIVENIFLSGDYQFVLHPAYNADRGPVNIFAIRVHTEF